MQLSHKRVQLSSQAPQPARSRSVFAAQIESEQLTQSWEEHRDSEVGLKQQTSHFA